MRGKLALDLNDLAVDSFETSRPSAKPGTVVGAQCTCPTACTCPGCPTCDATCGGATCGGVTCAASCNGSCNYSCNYTDCDCVPATCQETNCGQYLCCA